MDFCLSITAGIEHPATATGAFLVSVAPNAPRLPSTVPRLGPALLDPERFGIEDDR